MSLGITSLVQSAPAFTNSGHLVLVSWSWLVEWIILFFIHLIHTLFPV
jgi:hypothetical protein